MPLSSVRRHRTSEATYTLEGESDHDPSIEEKAGTNTAPESLEVRKSSRKKTLKRFDDFYVDITFISGIREKHGEANKKGSTESVCKRAQFEPVSSNTAKAMKKCQWTVEEGAPSQAIASNNDKKQGRKLHSKPVPSGAVDGSTQKSFKSTHSGSQISCKAEDSQLRKSSRKRTPKCFDSSFIDDSKIPKRRQTIIVKHSKGVSTTNTSQEKKIKVKIENSVAHQSAGFMQQKEHDSAQSSCGPVLGGDNTEMHNNNNPEDKPDPITSNTCESNRSKSVRSLDDAKDEKANSDAGGDDVTDSNVENKSSVKIEQKEHSSYSDSKPENSDPSEERGKVIKRRKRRMNRSRKCEVCSKEFQKAADLDKHMLMHTGEKPFECDMCGKRFTQLGNMKTHRMIHTGKKPFQCSICGKAFVRAGDLKCHKVKHSTERPFKCDLCTKAFKTTEHLKSHKEIHMNCRPFKCDECNKGFPKLGGLKAHKVIHTGVKSFKCCICSKSFYTAGNLKEHEILHTGIKPFSCIVCGSKFTKKSSLKKHMMLHTGERPFSCDYCGKGYTNRGEWEIHRRTHTGERPFQCDRCNSTFHRKANLLQHISAVHMGMRPYICNVCGKAFTEARCLKEHLLIHSGEKPHRCEKCNKSFTQSSTLKAHMRSHSGDKPFPCKYCSKAFADVSSRNRHHRIHTGEKPYKCSQCSAAFARLELCKAHMQHEHNLQKSGTAVVAGKRSPIDHSYDVPATTLGQSDVKTLTFVKDDADPKPPVLNTELSVQHPPPLHISSQEHLGSEQFVITVTDGTQIILQMDLNTFSQISSITEHLSNDHPYVVTSPGVLEQDEDSKVNVIKVEVIDEEKTQQEPTAPLISIINQQADMPSGAVSLLGTSQASIPSSLINTPVQAFSDPALYLPGPHTAGSGHADILGLTYIKCEVDTLGVPESVITDSEVAGVDSMHTAVVESEDFSSVLSGPVIVKSEVPSSEGMTYTAVSSQGSSSGPAQVSDTGTVDEVTCPTVVTEVDNSIIVTTDMSNTVVVTSEGINSTVLTNVDDGTAVDSSGTVTTHDDQSQADDLREDDCDLQQPSSNLLDTSRTILRDLLTDPASSSVDSLSPGDIIKTSVGVLRMKKRRYAAVPKGFFCEVCGHGFTQASSLKKHHILLHSADKPFVCEVCQKGSTSRSELDTHMRMHTGEKPFKCGHCGVFLRRKANLDQHIRAVHMQHRPHRCDVCGRLFTEARSLKDHKLIHLGARPHKCSCGKAFTQLGTLKKHQRTHTGQRKYICTTCTKCFTDSAALKRHQRLHTGERPYRCEYCPLAFFRSEQLRSHKRSEHPDNLDDLASIALATSI